MLNRWIKDDRNQKSVARFVKVNNRLIIKKVRFAFLATLFTIFNLINVFGQEKDSASGIGILPLPTIGYQPETNLYFGAVALFSFQTDASASSNFSTEITYTLRNQWIGGVEHQIFGKKLFFFGEIDGRQFPDLFWEEPSDLPLGYEYVRFSAQEQLMYRLKEFWGLGLNLQVLYQNITNSNGHSEIEQLRQKFIFMSLGPSFLFDSRKNPLNAQKATYFLSSISQQFFESGLNNNPFFVQGDFRLFRKVKKATLATNILAYSTSSSELFQYLMMGNETYARGYYQGRYRFKNMLSMQAEWRQPIWRRFGLATFLSYAFGEGDINHNITAGGLGLRFKIDRKENINLRFDYAVGKNSSGFYVGFGEAF